MKDGAAKADFYLDHTDGDRPTLAALQSRLIPALRSDWLAPALVFAISILSRSINLLIYPAYGDEIGELMITRIVQSDPLRQYWQAAKWGHLPFLSWLHAIVFPVTSDFLLAGRLISVLFGASSAVGLYLLGKTLYNRRVGMVAAGLYIVSPVLFFVDRYMYFDSPLVAWAIYTVLFSVLLSKATATGARCATPYAVALGASLGLGLLTKPTAVLFLLFPPIVWFMLRGTDDGRYAFPRLKHVGIAAGVASIAYLRTMLDPAFTQNLATGRQFSLSAKELANPIRAWLPNLRVVAQAFFVYTPVQAVVTLYGLWEVAFGAGRWRRRDLLTIALPLVPALYLIMVARTTHAKYVAFVLALACVFGAVSLVRLAGRLAPIVEWVSKSFRKQQSLVTSGAVGIIAVLVMIPSVQFDYLQMTDPVRAPWVSRDREYFESVVSGYGVKESIKFLRSRAAGKDIALLLPSDRDPDEGFSNYAYPYFLENDRNIHLIQGAKNFFDSGVLDKNVPMYAVYVAGREVQSGQIMSKSFLDTLSKRTESKVVFRYVRPGGYVRLEVRQVLGKKPGSGPRGKK